MIVGRVRILPHVVVFQIFTLEEVVVSGTVALQVWHTRAGGEKHALRNDMCNRHFPFTWAFTRRHKHGGGEVGMGDTVLGNMLST